MENKEMKNCVNISPKPEKFSTFFGGDYQIKTDGTDTHGMEPKCYVSNSGISHQVSEIPVVHVWDLYGMTREEFNQTHNDNSNNSENSIDDRTTLKGKVVNKVRIRKIFRSNSK